jgi:integrase/recombinase XerD
MRITLSISARFGGGATRQIGQDDLLALAGTDGRITANPAQYVRRPDGSRLDRRTAHGWVRSIGKIAGLGDVHPHLLRGAFIIGRCSATTPPRPTGPDIHGRASWLRLRGRSGSCGAAPSR